MTLEPQFLMVIRTDPAMTIVKLDWIGMILLEATMMLQATAEISPATEETTMALLEGGSRIEGV